MIQSRPGISQKSLLQLYSGQFFPANETNAREQPQTFPRLTPEGDYSPQVRPLHTRITQKPFLFPLFRIFSRFRCSMPVSFFDAGIPWYSSLTYRKALANCTPSLANRVGDNQFPSRSGHCLNPEGFDSEA